MTPPVDPPSAPTLMTGPPTDGPPTGPLLPQSMARAQLLDRDEPVLSWTPLGTVDAGAVADVDGAGLVHLRGTSWSLDWWIGAEDRWHHPSREPAVRQHPVEDAPIVETAMRVPGGDVVHRAFAVRARSVQGGWDDSAVVVEVENSTAVPVALALVLRPFTLASPGRLPEVSCDGSVVRVDGRVAAVLSRPAVRVAHGRPGEPVELLAAGQDRPADAAVLPAGPDGLEGAFVVPLAHAATVRVLLPRPVEPPKGPLGLRRRATPVAEPADDWSAPDAATIASGWEVHSRAGARVELPEPVFATVLRASQRTLSLGAADGFLGEAIPPGASSAAERAAAVCEALARSGLVEPLGPLARALAHAQRLNGQVRLADGSDAGIALLHAAAPLLATGAPAWTDTLLGPVAKVVHRLGRGGAPNAGVGVADALARVAPALRSIGQPDVADEADRLAGELAAVAGRGAAGSSGTTFDAAGAIRARLGSGEQVEDAVAALLELSRLGSPGALVDRVDANGVPSGVAGYDPAAVAERLDAVLDLVLAESADGLALLPGWPASWWGQALEVHGVRTRWGAASFGVRWHGERPAILWEVEPALGVDSEGTAPVLTAPALDPGWRAGGWTGEALLAPVEVPPTLVAIRGAAPVPPAVTGADEVADPLPPAPEGGTFS